MLPGAGVRARDEFSAPLIEVSTAFLPFLDIVVCPLLLLVFKLRSKIRLVFTKLSFIHLS